MRRKSAGLHWSCVGSDRCPQQQSTSRLLPPGMPCCSCSEWQREKTDTAEEEPWITVQTSQLLKWPMHLFLAITSIWSRRTPIESRRWIASSSRLYVQRATSCPPSSKLAPEIPCGANPHVIRLQLIKGLRSGYSVVGTTLTRCEWPRRFGDPSKSFARQSPKRITFQCSPCWTWPVASKWTPGAADQIPNPRGTAAAAAATRPGARTAEDSDCTWFHPGRRWFASAVWHPVQSLGSAWTPSVGVHSAPSLWPGSWLSIPCDCGLQPRGAHPLGCWSQKSRWQTRQLLWTCCSCEWASVECRSIVIRL